MLTIRENELLTRVGAGTPCGELFRRYWQPVGMLSELTDETPTKFVRILGEDLVLFRDKSGRVGLLGDHCPHRGASLLYGRVEERGIACAYHGWLYDTGGNCLETPAEPADSLLHLTVKHKAYPVQTYCGLYWAYLGPLPSPVLPKYDLAEIAPIEAVRELPRLDCNWLQNVENTLDQAHVFILHQSTGQRGTQGSSTGRGLINELSNFEYSEVPFGISRRQVHQSGYDDRDLMIFPSTVRNLNFFSAKVPIDDSHTRQYIVFADLDVAGASPGEGQKTSNGGIEYSTESTAEAKSPPQAMHPAATYRVDKLRYQDFMVLETQGPIAARQNEHLATSDRGVLLLRTILKREIEKVQRGADPIGVIRDPDHGPIDTFINVYIDMVRRFPPNGGVGWSATAGADPAWPGPSASR